LKELGKRTPQLLASIGAIGAGVALMIDDRKDLGRLGSERNPPLPHHWIWGALSFIGGLTGLGLTFMDLLVAAPPPKKASQISPWDLVPQRMKEALK